jgi:beta-lactamase class A
MTSIMSRRTILAAPLVALSALAATGKAGAGENAAAQLGKLEKSSGGRLGVAALDTATGKRIEHRANERFAMCSTFKFLAAAAVLSRMDHGDEKLDRRVSYSSPIRQSPRATSATV